MKGSAFAKKLPPGPGDPREKMILDAVRRRDIAPITWMPIQTTWTNSSGNTYTAEFLVSKDALRIGDAEDSLRVTTNHKTAQNIADELGLVLPTPKLSDEIWRQSKLKLKPLAHGSWVNDQTMSTTARMVEQSNLVDGLIATAQAGGDDGLIGDVGKDWVTTIRLWREPPKSPKCEQGPIRAANYGWQVDFKAQYASETLPGIYVYQPLGLCHGLGHTDYSQVVRLIRRDVKVCGPGMGDTGCATIDINSIATDPALAGLVSHEGVLPAMRHPAVAPICESGDCPDGKSGGAGPSGGGTQPPPGGGTPPSTTPPTTGGCCPVRPAPDPDPTGGAPSDYTPLPLPIDQASMGTAGTLLAFGLGLTAGFYAMKWFLPSVRH